MRTNKRMNGQKKLAIKAGAIATVYAIQKMMSPH